MPLEEPGLAAAAAAAGVHASSLRVTGLERGDDGHGAGPQRRRQEGGALVQAGAGHLGPALPGREVSERGPAEEAADSPTGRIAPSGGRERKRNDRLRIERAIHL